jgi:hypothetical protein
MTETDFALSLEIGSLELVCYLVLALYHILGRIIPLTIDRPSLPIAPFISVSNRYRAWDLVLFLAMRHALCN